MIFSSTVVYYSDKEEAFKLLYAESSVEIYNEYADEEKCVIVIQAETTDKIDDITKRLLQNSVITDVAHSAFHFGEEIDEVS